MPTQEQEATMLRTAPLAEKIGISTRTVERWRRDGLIPFFKVSRRVIIYNLPEVLRALEAFKMPAHRKTVGD